MNSYFHFAKAKNFRHPKEKGRPRRRPSGMMNMDEIGVSEEKYSPHL